MIPSFDRGAVLVDTIELLAALRPRAREIIVVDQTLEHPPAVADRLREMESSGSFLHARLSAPSITKAMNRGLVLSKSSRVLFLDDDIVPDARLVDVHGSVGKHCILVAGQVLQPGEEPEAPIARGPHRFRDDAPRLIDEFMGGNFSVPRDAALELGGFDENFIGAAYRFEAEFAARFIRRHGPIHFQPAASIHHLAVPSGGTRQAAHHLRTSSPHHTAGAYYYLLRVRPRGWRLAWFVRPFRSIRTRHHLHRPWWIPATLLAELRGMKVALGLHRSGPSYVFEPAEQT